MEREPLEQQLSQAYGWTPEETVYISRIVQYPYVALVLILLRHAPSDEVFVGDIARTLDYHKSISTSHKRINSKRMRVYVGTYKVKGLRDVVVYSCVPRKLRPVVNRLLDLLLTVSPLFQACLGRLKELESERDLFPLSYERKLALMKFHAQRAREVLRRKRERQAPRKN